MPGCNWGATSRRTVPIGHMHMHAGRHISKTQVRTCATRTPQLSFPNFHAFGNWPPWPLSSLCIVAAPAAHAALHFSSLSYLCPSRLLSFLPPTHILGLSPLDAVSSCWNASARGVVRSPSSALPSGPRRCSRGSISGLSSLHKRASADALEPLSLTHRPTYPTSEWGAPPHWAGVPSLRSPRRSSNSAARGTGCNPDRRIRRIRPPNNPRASAMVLRLGSPTRAIPQGRTQA